MSCPRLLQAESNRAIISPGSISLEKYALLNLGCAVNLSLISCLNLPWFCLQNNHRTCLQNPIFPWILFWCLWFLVSCFRAVLGFFKGNLRRCSKSSWVLKLHRCRLFLIFCLEIRTSSSLKWERNRNCSLLTRIQLFCSSVYAARSSSSLQVPSSSFWGQTCFWETS